jgi:hypothetical protein
VLFGDIGNEQNRIYCSDTTNPATAVAENADKRPADSVLTDDCRVDWQVLW